MGIMRVKPAEVLAWCGRAEQISEKLLATAEELTHSIEQYECNTSYCSCEEKLLCETVERQLEEMRPKLYGLRENIHRLCEITLNSIEPIPFPTLIDQIFE